MSLGRAGMRRGPSVSNRTLSQREISLPTAETSESWRKQMEADTELGRLRVFTLSQSQDQFGLVQITGCDGLTSSEVSVSCRNR